MVNVRRTEESDLAAICDVHREAFGRDEGQENVDLVCGLLRDETSMPVLSLAAEIDGRCVGHILFTAVRVQGSEQPVVAQILAPLAVLPAHQRAGVGGALVREGLKQLAASGVELVFVLGHPEYYPRSGFKPARALGLEATHRIPA
ncbi:MAG: N-acetyltransferase, partial [Deltaproteobacteria bacterium]|nr:N-acetyltransferase [Deltaproteobacteria bacterium]